MAINLDERYPGRANPKSLSYPQGSFKNRTSPTSKDGTYLEQDWANDWAGFFQSLLKEAGIAANGVVDTAQASQYYDALIAAIRSQDASETQKGVLEIATTAESQALTADDVVITPKKLADAFGGANQSLGANGYQMLPGGLIIQWGRASASGVNVSTIPYPIAFPNAALVVVATDISSSPLYDDAEVWGINTHLRNASSFEVVMKHINATSSTAGNMFNFIAVGY